MKQPWTHIAKKIALFLIVPAIVCAFVAANLLNKNNVCNNVLIHIKNQDVAKFVTPTDVKVALVNANNIVPGFTQLKAINIAQLEAITRNNPWVKEANIYVDHRNNVNVDIVQKEPVLRWLNGDLVQSYLDADGSTIPVHPSYGANVPIVTSTNIGANIKEQKLKYQMVALCNFIKKDTFWNAAIAQINVTKQLQFELISNLGNHIILFGDTSNMSNKFARLFTFYKEVMPRDGWAKFQLLNLQFDNQIVATVNDSLQIINEKKEIFTKVLPTKIPSVKLPIVLASKVVKKTAVLSKPVTNNTNKITKAKQNLKELVTKKVKPIVAKNKQAIGAKQVIKPKQ